MSVQALNVHIELKGLIVLVEGHLHFAQFFINPLVVLLDSFQVVIDITVFRRRLAGRINACIYPHLRRLLAQAVQKAFPPVELSHPDQDLVDGHNFIAYPYLAGKIGIVDGVLYVDCLEVALVYVVRYLGISGFR